MKSTIYLLFGLILLSPAFSFSNTLKVPSEYSKIQDAINAAQNGDTILVADGTYNGDGNIELELNGKEIVVKSENGPLNCIIDGKETGYFGFGDMESYEGLNTFIEGFTIRNFWVGIGYLDGTCPTIKNSIIENCKGGGIFFMGGSPIIKNNIIQNNGGTGIECWNTSAKIISNTIRGNRARLGGGINISNSTASIVNNIISENRAESSGGGICTNEDSSQIVNNTIVYNSSPNGGGIYIYESNQILINNIIAFSESLNTMPGSQLYKWRESNTSATFSYCGGVLCGVTLYEGFWNKGPACNVTISVYGVPDTTIFVQSYERFSITIYCSVNILGNDRMKSYVYNDTESLEITSYLNSNYLSTKSRTLNSEGVYVDPDMLQGGLLVANCDTIFIKNCNLFGNSGGEYFNNMLDPIEVNLSGIDGNISADPLINKATYELLEGSPCIDAGTNDFVTFDKDFLGEVRIWDGDNDGIEIVDIGACEFQSSSVETQEYVSICQGEEYEGHTESAEFQRTLISSTGTDSIVTTHLTVNPVYETEEYVSICDGEDYLGFTEEGEHKREFKTVNDCDSVVTTHLTVNPVYNHTDFATINEGEPYIFGTQTLITSGKYTEVFESEYGCDSTVVLTLKVKGDGICINLKFKPGWNIFSVNNQMDSANMKNNFQSLIDNTSLVKIQDEGGNSLEDWGIFGGWTNNIGDINPTEGYKIKVGVEDSLEICGMPVDYPFMIPLKSGWNIAGYPHQINFDGMNIIQQLIDRGTLVKVQDEKGNSIEDWGIFGGWTNNIGDFTPGEGYKIKVIADDNLWITESYPKSFTVLPQQVATVHFHPTFKGNGVDHMNINLVGLPINIIKAGDELAIFDGATCVGAVTLMPRHVQSQTVSIAASAADSNGMAGFAEGNPIKLKLWKSNNNQEFTLEPEIVKGTSTFTKHETTIVNLEKYTTGLDGIPDVDFPEIKVYPNPFSDELTIEINLVTNSEVSVEVLNQLGQKVRIITTEQLLPAGSHKLTWDGNNESNQAVSPGIYHLRIGIDGAINHRKIILSK